MNPTSTAFILGYHGCDRDVMESVLAGANVLRPSQNPYDWLADGIYFWEHNAQRAYEFACEVRDRAHNKRQTIKTPAVIGAIVDLGYCLNLLDSRYITMVRQMHDDLLATVTRAGETLRPNEGGRDLLRRYLDCAVLRFLHDNIKLNNLQPFDSARAVFVEADPLYSDAGFAEKSHIQVCVRNPACIKGYFRPIDEHGKPLNFG